MAIPFHEVFLSEEDCHWFDIASNPSLHSKLSDVKILCIFFPDCPAFRTVCHCWLYCDCFIYLILQLDRHLSSHMTPDTSLHLARLSHKINILQSLRPLKSRWHNGPNISRPYSVSVIVDILARDTCHFVSGPQQSDSASGHCWERVTTDRKQESTWSLQPGKIPASVHLLSSLHSGDPVR